MLSRIQISAFEAVHQFRNFLLSIGFDLICHEIRMDGKWHNVRLEGQRGYAKSGGYVGYLDGFPQGLWRNHRTGDHGRWEPDGERVPIPPAEAARLESIRREREAARRIEEKRRHQARAEVAQRLWGRVGETDPDHPYLQRKGVQPHGIGQIHNVLIVPLTDPVDHRIWSVQFISRRGEKMPLRGARKIGLSHMLGEARDGQEIAITEGYSTAASVHEALGIPVAMAIDSGNLLPAAKSLRSRYPNSEILIAGDNDVGLTLRGLRNVGLEKAEQAAREICGMVSIPPAAQASLDWNDFAARFGREAIEAAIRRLSRPARSKPEP